MECPEGQPPIVTKWPRNAVVVPIARKIRQSPLMWQPWTVAFTCGIPVRGGIATARDAVSTWRGLRGGEPRRPRGRARYRAGATYGSWHNAPAVGGGMSATQDPVSTDWSHLSVTAGTSAGLPD